LKDVHPFWNEYFLKIRKSFLPCYFRLFNYLIMISDYPWFFWNWMWRKHYEKQRFLRKKIMRRFNKVVRVKSFLKIVLSFIIFRFSSVTCFSSVYSLFRNIVDVVLVCIYKDKWGNYFACLERREYFIRILLIKYLFASFNFFNKHQSCIVSY